MSQWQGAADQQYKRVDKTRQGLETSSHMLRHAEASRCASEPHKWREDAAALQRRSISGPKCRATCRRGRCPASLLHLCHLGTDHSANSMPGCPGACLLAGGSRQQQPRRDGRNPAPALGEHRAGSGPPWRAAFWAAPPPSPCSSRPEGAQASQQAAQGHTWAYTGRLKSTTPAGSASRCAHVYSLNSGWPWQDRSISESSPRNSSRNHFCVVGWGRGWEA